jgi:hypothetical protein
MTQRCAPNRVAPWMLAFAIAMAAHSAIAHSAPDASSGLARVEDGDASATAQDAPPNHAAIARQRLEDAWWTGPLIANSPAPLPKGRAYVESYLFDVRSPGSDAFGSQTYLLYGLSDRWTAGARPSFGYTRRDDGDSSSGVGVGDLTLHAQYALTTYAAGSRTPAIAVAIEASLPTGRYDRLDRASDGFGSGACTTTLAVYAQQYFWLDNGRLLRGRLNVGGSFSGRTRVRGRSVYGTGDGFAGHARPGASVFVDNAWEYSLTRRWVLSTDFYYRHDAAASVRDTAGDRVGPRVASDTFAVAPAIEYNWSARVGVIVGARFVAGRGHNQSSVTPIAALSVLM